MSRQHRHQTVLGLHQGASQQAIRTAFRDWLRVNNPLFETNADERWAKTQVLHTIEASIAAMGRHRRAH